MLPCVGIVKRGKASGIRVALFPRFISLEGIRVSSFDSSFASFES
jgi:hypothetical protein